MNNFLLLLFIFTLSGCQTHTEETNISESEIGLLFTSSGNEILKTGLHKISDHHILITVQREDSVILEEFDVLDANANSILCSLTAKYTVNDEQLINIANFLTYPHSVEDYKALIVVPKLRNSFRELCFSQTKEELLANNEEIFERLKEQSTLNLSSDFTITELKIGFFE